MFQNTYIQDLDFAKRVFRLALPGIIQALLNVSVNALNNLLAGHYYGEIEISALSQTASVFAIYEVITYGFASSCGILVAQYWGKKDRDKIEKIISIAIKLEVLLGLVFTAVMFLFSHSVMSIMTKDISVLQLGANYLKISSPVFLLYGVCNALYSSFSSLEMVNYVFWGNSICSLSNLALSYILIPKYGVIGAAVSALISRFVSFIFALIVLFKNKKISYEAMKSSFVSKMDSSI